MHVFHLLFLMVAFLGFCFFFCHFFEDVPEHNVNGIFYDEHTDTIISYDTNGKAVLWNLEDEKLVPKSVLCSETGSKVVFAGKCSIGEEEQGIALVSSCYFERAADKKKKKKGL